MLFPNKLTFAAMQRAAICLLIALLSLNACDNELNVTTDWKNIPVVYGVLSPFDTVHYIRIEKAFLDPSRSALEIAQIADSIYYDDLDAVLVDVSSGERYNLEAVDGNLIGLQRQEGIFATSPNLLYRVTAGDINLSPRQDYRLEINRSESLPLVTATTEIVSRPSINRPFFTERLRFQDNNFFKVLWLVSDNAAMYDVNLIIHFLETDPENVSEFVARALEWNIARNITLNEVEILGIRFYEYLAGQLEAHPDINRIFTGIDVEVLAGGEELAEFRRIQLANTGITSVGGDIPRYTNLSEGIGILTSSNRDLKTGYDLHPETLDSLRNGRITEELNF